MSKIIAFARLQKIYCEDACNSARASKNSLYSPKFRFKSRRRVDWRRFAILAAETEMAELAWARPCDIEDWVNDDLVAAVRALTESRIRRIAYAGRVLP